MTGMGTRTPVTSTLASAEVRVLGTKTPSTSALVAEANEPLEFGSPAFNDILQRLKDMTTAASQQWEILDRRHENYMSRFQILDTASDVSARLTSTMVENVHEIRGAIRSTTSLATEAKDMAQSLQETSTSLQQSLNSLTHRVAVLEPSPDTGAIDECLAAATLALQAEVDDLNVAMSPTSATAPGNLHSHPRQQSQPDLEVPAQRPALPMVSPNRHNFFVEGAEYDPHSEEAYATAHCRHMRSMSNTADEPHRRTPTETPTSPASNASNMARTRGRCPSHDKHFEYLYDGGDGIPQCLGNSTSPSAGGIQSPGGIPTPHHRAAMLQGISPLICDWHAGRSGELGDPITGTDLMEVTDAEVLGIDPAMAIKVVEEHFNLVQSWENPRWVQSNFRQFGNAGYGPYSPPSSAGPNISDIRKQITTWDKLSDLSPIGWQGFYNKLRRHALEWKIALMPFEAITLKYECQGHGLCPCGLGLSRWRRMGDALFTILEYLLPTTNAVIYTTITSLENAPSPANGYELLWILLKEFIPMFDPSKPAPLPTWPASGDIFEFGRLVLMYCDLAKHRGPPLTEAMRSRMFLNGVQGFYATFAQPYVALVNTYCPGRDGITRCPNPLPPHLTVLELAHNFYTARSSHASSPPHIHTAHTTTVSGHHIPHTSYASSNGGYTAPYASSNGGYVRSDGMGISETGGYGPSGAVPSLTQTTYSAAASSLTPHTFARPSHIQGFLVHAIATQHPQGPRMRQRRGPPDPTRRATRPMAFPRHEGPCDACGKYGHPAARCDMLAMALFLQRYSQDRANSTTMKEAEERWVQRNKKFLPRDSRSPHTILANYCAEMEFTEDQVDMELDWDYLAEEDAGGESIF